MARGTPGKGSETRQGVEIAVKRLAHARGLALPAYQTAEAAGMDLIAALPAKAPLTLLPLDRALVPTGLIIALPEGYEGQVRPRSGLALRSGVTVLNSPGTIDSDYRGEVKVLLVNLGREAVQIARGERIAQLVVAPVTRGRLGVAGKVAETARGAGGFGSTGIATAAAGRSRATRKKAVRRGGPAKKGKPGIKNR